MYYRILAGLTAICFIALAGCKSDSDLDDRIRQKSASQQTVDDDDDRDDQD